MGFFDRMRGKNNEPDKGSSVTAKDRLKMVLTHDRIKVSPEKMKDMKAEIIAVIAKYVPEIDPDSVDIALDQSSRYENKIVAEIPFTKERGISPDDNDGNDDLNLDDVLNEDLELLTDDDDTLHSRPKDEA